MGEGRRNCQFAVGLPFRDDAYAFQAACGLLVVLGFVVALSRLDNCDFDCGPVPAFHSYAAERVRHVNDAPRREAHPLRLDNFNWPSGRLIAEPGGGFQMRSGQEKTSSVFESRFASCLQRARFFHHAQEPSRQFANLPFVAYPKSLGRNQFCPDAQSGRAGQYEINGRELVHTARSDHRNLRKGYL